LFLPEKDLETYIESIGASFSWLEKEPAPKAANHSAPFEEKTFKQVKPLLPIQTEPRYIESFSSLTKEEVVDSSKYTPMEIPLGTLPPGKKTGLLLHTLIEQMIKLGFYQNCKSSASQEWIHSFVKNTENAPFENEIFSMVEKVFSAPLLPKALHSIPLDNLEVEFAFTFQEKGIMMTGFIDLVVIHEGKVFIIDWKSNYLPSYTHQNLLEEVAKHQYDLQARIYRAALLQSLRRKNLDLKFGGTYYVFLRALVEGQGILSL
ncbi:hypothetical protein COB21_03310, partial [Candidatus Aerophobetes bacterium]